MTNLSGVVEVDQNEMDRSWLAAATTRAVFRARDDESADAKEKLLVFVHVEIHVLPGSL